MRPLPTVLLPVGGRAVVAVVCLGRDDLPVLRFGVQDVELGWRRRQCGQHVTRPGRCPHCGHTITPEAFAEAIQAREAAVGRESAA